jgi:hypothetical protein
VADEGGHAGREGADELLALALAQGQTIRDAAVSAGISERTATRRWVDADFRQRVSELRGDMVARASGLMAEGMCEGATKLRELLKARSEVVQLGAAKALVELTLKVRNEVELESRVRELERKIAKEDEDEDDEPPGRPRYDPTSHR